MNLKKNLAIHHSTASTSFASLQVLGQKTDSLPPANHVKKKAKTFLIEMRPSKTKEENHVAGLQGETASKQAVMYCVCS